jgi:hypothetical protein
MIEPEVEPLRIPTVVDAPESPSFRAFGSGDFQVFLTEPMKYKVGSTHDTITVPKGFVTDFASIPREFWTEFPPTGEYKLAAVVHDYLYWEQPCTKEQSDDLFYIAMREQGVPLATRLIVYGGVAAGGRSAWEANRIEKAARKPRYIPSGYDHPPANMSWPRYRDTLTAHGFVQDTTRKAASTLLRAW